MKDLIARRAAALLEPGWVVNLGIGIPTLVSKYIDAGSIFLHTENGLLGVGAPPEPGRVDPNLIDAGKRPVTQQLGAAFFDSASSFAMIRGGHVDVAVLGALQVSSSGDIANWAVPGRSVLGVGGAMDLVVGAKRVVVTMTALSSSGEPKVVHECTYPLTARAAAETVITELSVFRVRARRLVLTELLGGASLADVEAATEAEFAVELSG